jgi:hypothetical protein
MTDAAKVVACANVLLARKLLSAERGPESEFNFYAGVGPACNAPDNNQYLCIDGSPIGKRWHLVNACEFLDDTCLIDRYERATLLEVGQQWSAKLNGPVRPQRGEPHQSPTARSALVDKFSVQDE